MEKFRIEGPVVLKGSVEISGAKNAILPLMAASILMDTPVAFTFVPKVMDVFTMKELLERLGAHVEWTGNGTILIDPTTIDNPLAPYDIVKKMRASIYVLGPLLMKFGKAEVSLPGGCAFGPRPVNFHLEGLKKLGADIKLEHGYIKARLKKPRGAQIVFDKKSVGATIHLMMTASLIPEETILRNAALEPEVVQVAHFLKMAGVKIYGEGTDTIVINGIKKLNQVEATKVIPDRIEAGTFAVAAYMTGGEVEIKNCIPEHISPTIEKLEESGADIVVDGERLVIKKRKGKIKPLFIYTQPFPGFPTDMQAQFMAMLSVADGTSTIKEGIYPDRFLHAFELIRLGADIKVEDGTAIINGVPRLTGAPVMASDLRASASLVLAGLIAEGTTIIDRIYHLDRGYEDFEHKLNSLGAKIERFHG